MKVLFILIIKFIFIILKFFLFQVILFNLNIHNKFYFYLLKAFSNIV